jgi:superfamily I DNA and RNA helicase
LDRDVLAAALAEAGDKIAIVKISIAKLELTFAMEAIIFEFTDIEIARDLILQLTHSLLKAHVPVSLIHVAV